MFRDKALVSTPWAAIALCAAVFQVSVAVAQEPACPEPALATALAEEPDRTGLPVYLDADRFTGGPGVPAEAFGKVILSRGDQRLETDYLRFDIESRELSLPKPLIYQDARVELQADERFVIGFEGSELVRGGGGPRCMTMPILRDEL